MSLSAVIQQHLAVTKQKQGTVVNPNLSEFECVCSTPERMSLSLFRFLRDSMCRHVCVSVHCLCGCACGMNDGMFFNSVIVYLETSELA